MQWCVKYHDILDRFITALDCNSLQYNNDQSLQAVVVPRKKQTEEKIRRKETIIWYTQSKYWYIVSIFTHSRPQQKEHHFIMWQVCDIWKYRVVFNYWEL